MSKRSFVLLLSLTNRFKRGYRGHLSLPGKRSPSVARMILFLYTGDYPVTGQSLSARIWPHMIVFAFANSFGLGALTDLAVTKFQATAIWHSSTFASIIVTVYDLPTECNRLQSVALLVCRPHFAESSRSPEWSPVLENRGTFTTALFRSSTGYLQSG